MNGSPHALQTLVPNSNPQSVAASERVRWVALIDVDEFLMPASHDRTLVQALDGDSRENDHARFEKNYERCRLLTKFTLSDNQQLPRVRCNARRGLRAPSLKPVRI